MGKSTLITQQDGNEAFQAYLKSQQPALDDYVSQAREELKALVKEHYTPYPDQKLLLSGKYSDLATVSDWDTKKLAAMVDTIAGSLFGGSVPAGTKKPEKELPPAILAISTQELLIASAAFSIITGILGSLGESLTTKTTRETKNKQVSPGINLFISVIENSFKYKGYFNDESILENVYVYEVHFSEKELLAVGHMNDLAAYEDQKAKIRKQIEKIDIASVNLPLGSTEEDLDKFTKMTTRYNGLLDALNKQLEELMKKYAPTGKAVALGNTAAGVAVAPAPVRMAAMPKGPEAIPYIQQKAAAILAAHG
jgi:hypothetical protein